MPQCPHCFNFFNGLTKHLVRGCPFAPIMSNSSDQKKRKSTTYNKHHSPRSNVIRQRKETRAIETLLSADTHNAPKNVVSDQLSLIPSLRHQVNQKRNTKIPKTFTDTTDLSDDDTNDEFPNKSYDSISNNSPSTTGQSNENHSPIENNNLEDEDFSFLQRFISFIDPDLSDPFDPDSVVEADLEFINSTHKHIDRLPVNILAQIDLLRMLSRAGCSLAMFDKIIKHYSRKVSQGNL